MSLVTRGLGRSGAVEAMPTMPPKIVSGEIGELFLYNTEVEPDVVTDKYIDPPSINVKGSNKKLVPEFG